MVVKRFESIPAGLLELPAQRLVERLDGPSLITLRGEREPPVFVSVLLHGNETSGWDALRQLLRDLKELPRSLILFIGNVEAAAAGVRSLPEQQDYNRVWRDGHGLEGQMAAEVIAAVDAQPLFAAIDLHNNTGRNPHYAIVTTLAPDSLALGYMFANKAVYAEEPATVQTRMFNGRCPAIATELGPIGDPRCVERGYWFLHRCLTVDELPPADYDELNLHRTVARVHVRDDVAFSFSDDDARTPLVLTSGMEAVNFHPIPAGTQFGVGEREARELLTVLDADHRDITDQFLRSVDGAIVLEQEVIPAMYTTDPVVIRQDCLCYFMRHYPLAERGDWPPAPSPRRGAAAS